MKKERKGFRQMVDEAKSRIQTIRLEDARSRLGKDDVVFVDVRDVRELEREGMVPGAFHCPRGMLEFWLDPDSPYHKDVFAADKEFVFYCNGAWRSAHAADVAQQMGLLDCQPRALWAGKSSTGPWHSSIFRPVFPDVQVLDVTGPLEVFALANRLSPRPGAARRDLGAGAVSPSLADSSVPGITAAGNPGITGSSSKVHRATATRRAP